MKKITTQLKTISCFIILMLFSFNALHAQLTSWDYVNFTNGNGNGNSNACLDTSDNVYTYGSDTSGNRVVRKFDTSGNLSGTINVSNFIDFSNDNTMAFGYYYSNGVGGIQHDNSKLYVGGNKNGHGVVIDTDDQSVGTINTWEQLSGSHASTVSDIKLKGGFLYISGFFGDINAPSTSVTFTGGTTLTGSYKSGYVAKYTYPSKTLVWAKKIHGSNITNPVNLDVDSSGNIFVSGHFRGTATFYNGTTPYTFTSSTPTNNATPDVFLAKFDTNGDFNATYSIKTDGLTNNYNWRSYDVKVSDYNNAVYWAMDSKVSAYSMTGSGSFLWDKTLAYSSDKPFNLASNACGDVYTTGFTGGTVNKNSKAPCGRTFFALGLNATAGTSIWAANSTSCISSGNEILIDSNNKQIVVGSYYTGGGSGNLNIDGTYSSTASNGSFIGRSNDGSFNSCCNDSLDLGVDVTVCEDGLFPTLDITSQVSGSPTITWYLGATIVQNGGTTYTTTQLGIYTVNVVYSQNCTATASMTVNNDGCCDLKVKLGSDIEICEGDAWPILDITGQIPSFTSIQWYHNFGSFPQPVNPQSITTFAPGNYTVQVAYGDGCVTSDTVNVSVVSCEPECDVFPKFKTKINNCTISFANLSYATGSSSIIGYLWEFGDGSTSTDANPVHTYISGGTFSVVLWVYGIDSDGNCCVKKYVTKVSIDISCKPECYLKPDFTASKIANGVFLFESSSITNGFTNIVGYEWTIDGQVVSNDPYFATYFLGGTVCLTIYGLTTNGDCCEERICKSYPYIGKTEELNTEFKVFPNPAKDKITFDFTELKTTRDIKITIVDVYGRVVNQSTTTLKKHEVNINDWPVGLYMCKVEVDDVITTKKIIKN